MSRDLPDATRRAIIFRDGGRDMSNSTAGILFFVFFYAISVATLSIVRAWKNAWRGMTEEEVAANKMVVSALFVRALCLIRLAAVSCGRHGGVRVAVNTANPLLWPFLVVEFFRAIVVRGLGGCPEFFGELSSYRRGYLETRADSMNGKAWPWWLNEENET